MKQTTKYRYEKRIKALEQELKEKDTALYEYKQVAIEIFNTTVDLISNDKNINKGWIVSKYKRLFL